MSKIEIKSVTKTFGSVKALDNVSLTLDGDKIIGLLGRNGAGKTTLLNIISNRIFATEGQVTINGENACESDKAQGQIYMMSERNYYPASMKVQDVLKRTSEMYNGALNMDYALKLCDTFGLDPKKKLKQLSTGYSSIYKIIVALSINVPIIMLDEPVLGLDANHRDLFYKLLLENYVENPRTIILSTHLIEEVSSVIEEVIIIKNGRIIRHEPCENLLNAGYTVTGAAPVVNGYVKDKTVIGTDALGGMMSAYLMGTVNKAELPKELEVGRMDLQKLFIQLTND